LTSLFHSINNKRDCTNYFTIGGYEKGNTDVKKLESLDIDGL
jgi:hypothetical protein